MNPNIFQAPTKYDLVQRNSMSKSELEHWIKKNFKFEEEVYEKVIALFSDRMVIIENYNFAEVAVHDKELYNDIDEEFKHLPKTFLGVALAANTDWNDDWVTISKAKYGNTNIISFKSYYNAFLIPVDSSFVLNYKNANKLKIIESILKESMYSFSLKFVSTIALWQGEASNSKQLLNLSIPQKFKQGGIFYKGKRFEKHDFKKFLANGIKYDNLSSWTKDEKIAKHWARALMGDLVRIVFKKDISKIVVDIDELWKDKQFLDAVKNYKKEAEEVDPGIMLARTQKEVVAYPIILTKNDIFKIWDSNTSSWKNYEE